ncbi:MAG TPA: helix-turn-helix transcriptional regulator [Verrucomicrobiae bacterium]|nr:helix-turn-helix transcriptional regulator [Verrucomicrobiae bacterium]
MTMSEVGDQLQAARKALKLTIQQIADVTKIRTDHLRALEEGHYEVFSAPVYIRGFVRIYAAQLKLNTAQIMSVLDAELKRSEKFKEPPPLMEESNTLLDHVMFWLSKFNWRVGVIGGGALVLLVAVLLAGSAWRHHARSNPLAGMKPAMYQSANAGETLPLTTHR